MIEFETGGIYPLIKVMSPLDTYFFSEHRKVIDEYGAVWFCRFGKNNMKIESFNPVVKL